MVALGNFLFRYSRWLSPLPILFLLLPGRAIFEDPFVAAVLGLIVASIGQAVRATTIALESIVRGGRQHRGCADDLATEGILQHTRNPMYVGKFLMVLGVGVAANRWPALLGICTAYAFMYHAMVLAEEAYLREKFGTNFDEYCSRVPRWLPRLRGLRATIFESEFQWARVLLKEYSTPLGWGLPIVAIGLYNLEHTPGDSLRQAILLTVLGLIVVFWLAAAAWLKWGSLERSIDS